MQKRIDFTIIGAQKSGTTSLYEMLAQHESIFLPKAKEINYFADDEPFSQGERYLDTFYRDARHETILGGAYVHNLYFPITAQRLYDHNPNMLLIAVLRNPIERAYSAYWFARRNGWENLDTFEAALDAEPQRLHGRPKERSELTYVSHGEYSRQLRPFLERFGADRVKIYLTEDIKHDSAAVLQDIFSSLQCEGTEAITAEVVTNVSAMPRSKVLQKLLVANDSSWKRWVRRLVPHRFRYFVKQKITRPLMRLNLRPYRYPPMRPETRERLVEHFRPHRDELAALLGRDLSFWH